MTQCLKNVTLHLKRVMSVLFVLGFVFLASMVLLIIHDPALAFWSGQTSTLHSQVSPALTPLSTPTITNANTTPLQDLQNQQLLTEAQNDVSVANGIVTFTGVFVSIVAAAVTIAGFLEIRGLRLIEAHIQQVTNLERQIEREIEQLTQRSENERQMFVERVQQLDERSERESQLFELRLEQLAEHFEIDSQNFMEASYNFNQGKDAYNSGDNVHAIEYFSQANKLQPQNARILERLGRTYSNLNDTKNAIFYLEKALEIVPSNLAALRSLALCYRDIEPEKAIDYLNRALEINAYGFEALDFLGLIYRDQGLIDEAISYHERAFSIKKRPETEFYLSILYAKKGDMKGAKIRALSAEYDTNKPEHNNRIRPVWKNLIQLAVHIIEGDKERALGLMEASMQYITTQRIYEALKGHLQFLLEATDHKNWLPEFMEFVHLREI